MLQIAKSQQDSKNIILRMAANKTQSTVGNIYSNNTIEEQIALIGSSFIFTGCFNISA